MVCEPEVSQHREHGYSLYMFVVAATITNLAVVVDNMQPTEAIQMNVTVATGTDMTVSAIATNMGDDSETDLIDPDLECLDTDTIPTPIEGPTLAVGTYNISVTAVNNRSEDHAWAVIEVDEAILDYAYAVVHGQEGVAAEITPSATQGTRLNLICVWGDGTANDTATYTDFTGLVALQHDYTAMGLYEVTLLVSNGITTERSDFIIGKNTPIAGFATAVDPTVFGTPTIVTVSITAGNFMTIGADFGDNVTIFINFCEDPPADQTFNYTYTTPGVYVLEVKGMNYVSDFTNTPVVHVEEVITDVTVTKSTVAVADGDAIVIEMASDGVDVTGVLAVTMANGTHVNMTGTIDGTNTDSLTVAVSDATTTGPSTAAFSLLAAAQGNHSMVLTLENHLSIVTLTHTLALQVAITGHAITATGTGLVDDISATSTIYTSPTVEFTCTMTMTTGTDVTTEFTWDDVTGVTVVLLEDNAATFMLADVGSKQLTATSSNLISSENVVITVGSECVLDAVGTTMPDLLADGPNIDTTATLTVTCSVMTGVVQLAWTTDGTPTAACPTSLDLATASTATCTFTFSDYGTYPLSVDVSNNLGSVTASANADIGVNLQPFTLVKVPDCGLVNEGVTFSANLTGSINDVTVDWGDGTAAAVFDVSATYAAPTTVTLDHTFTTADTYQITATVRGSITGQEETSSVSDYIVEGGFQDTQLTIAPGLLSGGNSAVNIIFVVEGGANVVPTGANCNIDYVTNDANPGVGVSMAFAPDSFTHPHSYTGMQSGSQTVSATCTNCGQQHTFTAVLELDEQAVIVDSSPCPDAATVNVAYDASLRVTGTRLNVTVDCGCGATPSQELTEGGSDGQETTVPFTCTYTAPQNCTLVVSLNNTLAEGAVFTKTVVVQHPVPEFSVTTGTSIPCAIVNTDVTFTVTMEAGVAGPTDPFVTIWRQPTEGSTVEVVAVEPTYAPGLDVDTGGATFQVVYTFTGDDGGQNYYHVNVSNMVSSERQSVTQQVSSEITDFALKVKLGAMEVNVMEVDAMVSIEASASGGTNYNYTVYFGDGDSDTFAVGEATSRVHTFTHAWEVEDVYELAVSACHTCEGELVEGCELTHSKDLIVQVPIVNSSIQVTGDVLIANPPGIAEITVLYTDDLVPQNVNVTIFDGDVECDEVVVEAWPWTYTHTFDVSVRGRRNVMMLFKNLVSSATVTRTFTVEQEVDGLDCIVPAYIPCEDAVFDVTMTAGSNVIITIKWANLDAQTQTLDVLPDGTVGTSVNKTFSSEDTHVINITASNSLNSKNILRTPNCKFSAQNLVLDLNNNTPWPHFRAQDAQWCPLFKQRNNCTYDDGTTKCRVPDEADLSVTVDGVHFLEKLYQRTPSVDDEGLFYWELGCFNVETIGAHPVEILLYNEVSDNNLVATLESEAGIEDLDFILESLEDYRAQFLEDLTFIASLAAGTNYKLLWDFTACSLASEYEELTEQLMMAYTPEKPGQCTASLHAWNNVSDVVVTHVLSIVSAVPLANVDYLNSGWIDTENYFSFTLESDINVCFQMEFLLTSSESSIFILMGKDQGFCNMHRTTPPSMEPTFEEVIPIIGVDGQAKYNWSFTPNVIDSYDFTCEVIAEDNEGLINSLQMTNVLTITDIPCESPNMTARAEVSSGVVFSTPAFYPLADPVLEFKSSSFFSVSIECLRTTMLEYTWSLERYIVAPSSENDPNQLVDIASSGGLIDGPTLWYSAVRTLLDGCYRGTVRINMEGAPQYNDSKSIFLCLTLSPIAVSLNDDGNTYMSRKYETWLQLQAAEFTTDPNQLGEDYMYSYTCWKEGETEPGDGGLVINLPSQNAASPNAASPGCFGTGSGVLNVNSGTVEIWTGAMVVHQTYHIKVKCTSPTRTAISAIYSLVITEGDPLELTSSCVGANCKARFDADSEIKHTISCANCATVDTSLQASYTCSLTNQDGTTQAAGFHCEAVDNVFTVQVEAGVLVAGQTYQLGVTATATGMAEGVISITLVIDQPPSVGSCSITPPSGPALGNFHCSCLDFMDPEGDPLTFEYEFSLDAGNTYTALLGASFSLPGGMEENDFMVLLKTAVTDGISTTVVTQTVQVTQIMASEVQDAIDELLSTPLGTLIMDAEQAFTSMTATGTAIEQEDNMSLAASQEGSSEGGDGSSQGGDDSSQGGGGASQGGSGSSEEQDEEDVDPPATLAVMQMTTTIAQMTGPSASPGAAANAISTFSTVVGVVSTASSDAVSAMAEAAVNIAPALSNMQTPEAIEEHAGGLMSVVTNLVSSSSTTQPPADSESSTPSPDEVYDEQAADAAAAAQAQRLEKQKRNSELLLNVLSMTSSAVLASVRNNGGVPATSGDEDCSTTAASIGEGRPDLDLPGGKSVNFAPMLSLLAKRRKKRSGGSDTYASVTSTSFNLYSWDSSATDVDAGVLGVGLSDENGEEIPILTDEGAPLEVSLTNSADASQNAANMSNSTVNEDSGLLNFYLPLDKNDSAIFIQLEMGESVPSSMHFYLYFNFNTTSIHDPPNATWHDAMVQLPIRFFGFNGPEGWRHLLSENVVGWPGVYMSIDWNDTAVTTPVAPENKTVPDFTFQTAILRCRAWDSAAEKWTGEHCKVGAKSTLTKTECQCTALPPTAKSFSGGLTMPTVNPIDFSYIFNNFAALLGDNPVVFITVFGLLGLYIILGVLMRRLDKRDIEKWSVSPLKDNPLNGSYFFKISVYTGLRNMAGTKSNVCFILSGDYADTGLRTMDDDRGKNFPAGSVRHFVMSTPTPLGSLSFLRIWHDNSGKREHQGWYLDKVIVEDVQNGRRYYFLNSRWLAADEDDGLVQRMLPVAAEEEIIGFAHLFFSSARKKLTDEHLWFSLFSRPTRSSFTRLQRLACCMSLLFSTMIANAMWYREEPAGDSSFRFTLGPFSITFTTLMISVFGTLTVLPINLIIVTLFRKAKPKVRFETPAEIARKAVHMAHEEKAVRDILFPSNTTKDQFMQPDVPGEHGSKSMKQLPELPAPPPEADKHVHMENYDSKGRKKKWYKQKYPLPWWCTWIAWVLSTCTILTACFFIIMYSLMWGADKANTWLVTLLLSFGEDSIIIQPIKVVVLAMLISCIIKKLDDDDEVDDDAEDEKKNQAIPATDEELLEDAAMFDAAAAGLTVPDPPNEEELLEARKKREYERMMWSVTKECAFYLFFLLLISFIAWGSRDGNVYLMNAHVNKLLRGAEGRPSADLVSNGFQFWKWCEKTLVPILYDEKKYNGDFNTFRERSYLADGANYRVGSARLRQVRLPRQSTCTLFPKVENIIHECHDEYSMFAEEDRHFTPGWEYELVNFTYSDLSDVEQAYVYRDVFELSGLPFWGHISTYGGGGYVADLTISPYSAIDAVHALQEDMWVDQYTRAVFVEFTVYNPNTNLFAYINMLFEFPYVGGAMPFPTVLSFQVYRAQGDMGSIVFAAQILYIFILIYFMIHEIFKLKKQKKSYFREPWNIYEIVLIIVSWIGISMFALKQIYSKTIMASLQDNLWGFTNYMQFAYYDDCINIVVGVIVFLANIKFLRLLRFNHHIVFLSKTLRHAGRDLGAFTITFFVIFMAFTFSAWILFGSNIKAFMGFLQTMSSLYSMLLGKFDLTAIRMTDPALGPLFFVAFILTVYFILVNMFLGILGLSFYEVRLDPSAVAADQIDFIAFFKSRYHIAKENLLKTIRRKADDKQEDEERLKDSEERAESTTPRTGSPRDDSTSLADEGIEQSASTSASAPASTQAAAAAASSTAATR